MTLLPEEDRLEPPSPDSEELDASELESLALYQPVSTFISSPMIDIDNTLLVLLPNMKQENKQSVEKRG